MSGESTISAHGNHTEVEYLGHPLWCAIVRLVDAFVSSTHGVMVKNPVMFVVEVGAALTTILLIRDIVRGTSDIGFELQITIWLWFTVLFANLAEAMAEGRGKAQADTLRKTRTETMAQSV